MDNTNLNKKLEEIESTKSTLENAVGKTVTGTMLGIIGVGLLAKGYNIDPNAALSSGLFCLSGAGAIATAAYFFGTGIHTINDNIEKLYKFAIKNYSEK